MRGTADRIDVHTIGARTDSSAKARGSELEVLKKRIGDSFFVTVFFKLGELGEQLRILHMLDPRIEQSVNVNHQSLPFRLLSL